MSSRSDAELDASNLGGGATKKSARPVATRRADGGCGRSLCGSSSKMAKHRLPPPALISPRKPHLQTYRYLQNAVLAITSLVGSLLILVLAFARALAFARFLPIVSPFSGGNIQRWIRSSRPRSRHPDSFNLPGLVRDEESYSGASCRMNDVSLESVPILNVVCAVLSRKANLRVDHANSRDNTRCAQATNSRHNPDGD